MGTTGGSRDGKVLKRFKVKRVHRAGVKDVSEFLLLAI